ncbi:glutathione peroxidase [Glycomyces terrestris]|uniref:Glutathione peroxidase n=1 Tax=Glycomyces terrestris TaxID=2493553 RepID=A0A426UV35_9ACTN|nr:glutathione peroxidase [Glycomyces terrestris]RRR98205.1 glutathione peroxidase [Glycomyces terrestris]
MSDLTGIGFHRNDGGEASLADYLGQVVLVVNTASKCGLTPQYEGLQRAHEEYRDRGFTVVGFPANDFMGQEPGTDEEIAEFCSVNYAVTFPLMAKISVAGETRHPLYTALVQGRPRIDGKPEGDTADDPEVQWNFEKFLLDRGGRVVARFAPTVTPDDPALRKAIEAELERSTACP